MTYEDSSALMSDTVFRGRVKVACLSYAQYISDEPTVTPGHSARIRWQQKTFANPEFVAQEITPPAVMQEHVQAAGANVSDSDLQTDVENVVNKML